MNNEEINKFRKDFYKKLEKHIMEKDNISISEYNDILNETIMQTKIESETSNKIMVYTGSYIVSKTQTSTKEYLTYDENPKIKYKQYIDVETGEIYKVSLPNVTAFKKEYIVLDLPVDMYNLQEYLKNYNEIRRFFFKKILYNPQEEVVLKLDNKVLK